MSRISFYVQLCCPDTFIRTKCRKRQLLMDNQPQLPESQEPAQPPPPPIGLVEVIPKPERGPASTKSTLIEPHVVSRLSSTRNLRSLFSYTLSLSFGSSRASPRDGPAQPPCIKATRSAESILFCSIYSFSFSTAKSVTLKSDIMPPCNYGGYRYQSTILGFVLVQEPFSVPPQNKVYCR